jgi:hypothetical protein
MKKDELKERFDKLDERIPVLIKKYPLVSTVMVVVPFVVGVVVGALL